MDIQKLREILEKDGSFAIVVGQDYGMDEMAGALSLYLILRSSGKNVSVVSSRAPLVEVSNLVGISEVKPRFESKNGDLVVSFPYQEDEIGKVSYTLEGGFLNIIVKPKENALSFGENDVIFRRSSETPAVLITVGVKRFSELSSMFNIESLKDTTIVNIDKPGNNEGFGDIVIMGQGTSSVSEQVTNILLSLAYPMDQDIAQNLMNGIVSATGNFQREGTSSLAFEMAGILLRNGARRESVRATVNLEQQRVLQQLRNIQRPQQQIKEFPGEQKKDDQPARPAGGTLSRQKTPADWLTPKIYKGSTTVE